MTGWPDIPYEPWVETCTALHLYAQIVGKVRLSLTPWVNHAWHATLYVVPRGLTTGPIHAPTGCFALTFDIQVGQLVAEATDGAPSSFDLGPMSVAAFHDQTRKAVQAVGGPFPLHRPLPIRPLRAGRGRQPGRRSVGYRCVIAGLRSRDR